MVFGWTGARAPRHMARVLSLVVLIACWLAGTPAWASSVESIRVESDRVVIEFDARVADASAFLLDAPTRIALDLKGVAPGGTVSAAGPVAGIRQAARGNDGARIVFDLEQPAIVAEGKLDRDGRTLTLELRSVDPDRFARAASAGRMWFTPAMGSLPPKRRYSVTIPVPPAQRGVTLPRVYGDDDSRPLVVIDAGHGGHDPGALSADGLKEKDLTLAIARVIRDELVRSGRARVALTREDDRYLVLRERFGIARKLGASLFISIHCDSAGNPEASGATVYTLSEVASDKEAALLAARENKADIISGVNLASTNADISSILIDLAQRETMNSSAAFARLLGREARELMPVKPNPHRMASLLVLKAPDMPSVLFETGYISNEKDAKFLNSPEGRQRVAQGVRRAVEIHFAQQRAGR